MILRRCTVLSVLLLFGSGANADILKKCAPLVFSADGSAAVHEHIPGFAPRCYSFTAQANQRATIAVSRENKMKFSIVYDRLGDNLTLAIADDETGYNFVTEAKTYRILVASSDLHASTDAYFTLTATLK